MGKTRKKKEIDRRYMTATGRFKPMTPVKGHGKKDRFNGCVRYMMSKGYSYDSACRICGKIAREKGK